MKEAWSPDLHVTGLGLVSNKQEKCLAVWHQDLLLLKTTSLRVESDASGILRVLTHYQMKRDNRNLPDSHNGHI